MNKLEKRKMFVFAITLLLLPGILFGGDDDFVLPFLDMIKTWISGNVGLTGAILVMIISIVWAIAGGGFGKILVGFIFSIFIGSALFWAEKAFNLGQTFA